MKQTYSPALLAASALALGLAVAFLVLWVALSQPWLGVRLVAGPDDSATVYAVHPDGPAEGSVPQGATLLSVAAPGFPALPVDARDLTEEPDALPDPAAMRAFFAKQAALHARMAAATTHLLIRPQGATDPVMQEIRAAATRPLGDLPGVFWVQLGVGLAGVVLGGWVMALRRDDRAVQFFGLAGLGLMISADAAALYSTRELALSAEVFTIASRLNYLGTLVFGIGMINLFLIYPSGLAGRAVLWSVAALFGICILTVFVDWPDALLDRQAPVALAMLILLAAVLAQVVMNRRNPTARAMLGWFGLSVLVGAGGFGLTVTLPLLMGATPSLSQGYAFLFFLVIFVGLAMGIARYRLFELSDWSFRILFYMGGVLLLLVLDAALILGLALDRAPALGLALAVVGLVYLPLRDVLARHLRNDRGLAREELFALVGDVALATRAEDRDAALHALLQRLFDPLRIEQGLTAFDVAGLRDGGETLEIPLPHGLPGIRLHWARQGRALFNRRDEQLARSVVEMLDRSIARQRAHDAAVETERRRINRDMHDNIGVQLLGALHSSDAERKDMLIRQTLSDLRQIVSNPAEDGAVLAQLLADLRREIGDHLEAAGIGMGWQDSGLSAGDTPQITLTALQAQTVRALLRETVSNALRHSEARNVLVRFLPLPGERLSLIVEDDGTGTKGDWLRQGSGLSNLRFRVEACGGTLVIEPAPGGTRVRATLPLAGVRAPDTAVLERAAG